MDGWMEIHLTFKYFQFDHTFYTLCFALCAISVWVQFLF